MAFRIFALDPTSFSPLFHASDADLASHHARRVTATHSPGFPCRVSLQDAEPGEELLLINFQHQPAATPFRASHAIYVRKDAAQASPAIGEVPAFLRTRTLSLRAFSSDGMMRAAEVVPGSDLEQVLVRLLAAPETAYLHIHNAAMGCYLARAERPPIGRSREIPDSAR